MKTMTDAANPYNATGYFTDRHARDVRDLLTKDAAARGERRPLDLPDVVARLGGPNQTLRQAVWLTKHLLTVPTPLYRRHGVVVDGDAFRLLTADEVDGR